MPGILFRRRVLPMGSFTFESEASALFARMTTPPTAARQMAINTCIRSLKTAGVWNRLDALQVYAAADSQAALLDWKNASRTATLHGTPTPVHYANKHFYSAGGAGTYLNTKFNPSTSTLYQQNDASLGFYNGHGNTGSVYSGISTSGLSRGLFVHATPRFDISVNDTAERSSSTQSAYGRIAGLCSASRTGASAGTIYVRGIAANTFSSASTTRANAELFIFANNLVGTGAVNPGANKISAFFAGAALDAAQTLALSNALDTYMNTIGGVITRVACWGDSLTSGGNTPYGADWRHQVEQGGSSVVAANPYRWVYNGGVSGESATQIRTRMVADTTYRDHDVIIWAGRNGFLGQTATVLAEIDTMVNLAVSRGRRYLVLSVLNGQSNGGVTAGLQGSAPFWEDIGFAPHTDITTINTALSSTYGANYVDVRGPLVAAGTAPEIARDVVANSCHITNDPIHINTAGALIVGNAVNAAMTANGWT